MTETTDVVARLAQHRTLGSAPREELAWLAAHGEVFSFDRGNLLAVLPEVLDTLAVLLSGHFAIYVDHGAGPHKVMEWSGGDVTGVLPYSRMSKPLGEMVVDEAGDALLVKRQHFPALIRECPTITEKLVHIMIDRARHFRSSELQDEKLLSLGRLAAGLAHELNNPASAVARSAELLTTMLEESEQAARELGAAKLDAAQLAAVDRARQVCAMAPAAPLTPIDRADREDAITAWLEAHGADPDAAASLVDTTLTIQGLDELAASTPDHALDIALRWVSAGCTTRSLASDIERAAARISKLVGAMKNYLYMDRALAPEPVDLVASVNDSVALLTYKARKKSVGIDVKMHRDLPPVRTIGGDLNQVWMNLIDNAVDAAPENGRVAITTSLRPNHVVVHIIDNGAGIPRGIRDQIFDPFVTTKPVGRGTGLGLDIARQLARRNGGDIEVDSEPGRTEFRVVLPVAHGEREAPAASTVPV